MQMECTVMHLLNRPIIFKTRKCNVLYYAIETYSNIVLIPVITH